MKQPREIDIQIDRCVCEMWSVIVFVVFLCSDLCCFRESEIGNKNDDSIFVFIHEWVSACSCRLVRLLMHFHPSLAACNYSWDVFCNDIFFRLDCNASRKDNAQQTQIGRQCSNLPLWFGCAFQKGLTVGNAATNLHFSELMNYYCDA